MSICAYLFIYFSLSEKHLDSVHSRFSKEFVLESIKIILGNDNCIFKDAFYSEISGTAMDTI